MTLRICRIAVPGKPWCPDGASAGFEQWRHVLSDDDARVLRYLTRSSDTLAYVLPNNGFYIRALPGFSVGEESRVRTKRSYEAAEHFGVNVALPTSLPAAPGSDLSVSAYWLQIAL